MNKKYILKEIKKANELVILVFNFLYKLNSKTTCTTNSVKTNTRIKTTNKTLYRLTEINEILTNLEIYLEGDSNNE